MVVVPSDTGDVDDDKTFCHGQPPWAKSVITSARRFCFLLLVIVCLQDNSKRSRRFDDIDERWNECVISTTLMEGGMCHIGGDANS